MFVNYSDLIHDLLNTVVSSILTLTVFWIRPDLLQVTIIKKLKSIFYNRINSKSDRTVAAFSQVFSTVTKSQCKVVKGISR